MQGNIDNALMLVAAGNARLRGKPIDGFWPNAGTWRFSAQCEFRDQPEEGAGEPPIVAADPMAWLNDTRFTGYRLHHAPPALAPTQMAGVSSRMLVAFVGGGPRWLIERMGVDGSEVWEGYQRIGDRNHPEGRLWLSTWVRIGRVQPADVTPERLVPALSAMRAVLPEIESFARAQNLDQFADCFHRALDTLEAPTAPAGAHDDFERYGHGGHDALRALAAVQQAWVFGGMGSWNDVGGDGPDYERLSDALFSALCDAICGAANSTCAAGTGD